MRLHPLPLPCAAVAPPLVVAIPPALPHGHEGGIGIQGCSQSDGDVCVRSRSDKADSLRSYPGYGCGKVLALVGARQTFAII